MARAATGLGMAVMAAFGLVLFDGAIDNAPQPRPPAPAATSVPTPTAVPMTTVALPAPPLPSPPPPTPTPPPSVAAPARTIAVSPADRVEGRALLRLLEHGDGPAIEIAWPRAVADREALHRVLARCHGMRTAVLAGGGRLFGPGQAPGRAWHWDGEGYSPFVRRPAGFIAAAEAGEARRIRRRHRLDGGAVVRLFPRTGDAALLGGLKRLLGGRYEAARAIRAAYRIAGPTVFIDAVRVDGDAIGGRIALPPAAGCT